MYAIKYSSRFKKDLKKIYKAKILDMKIFLSVIDILQDNKQLPEKYRNHQLHGEFKGYSECHLKPNVLLIYKIDKKEFFLYLLRIGSHTDLFG